jgi:hypothetical protein
MVKYNRGYGRYSEDEPNLERKAGILRIKKGEGSPAAVGESENDHSDRVDYAGGRTSPDPARNTNATRFHGGKPYPDGKSPADELG